MKKPLIVFVLVLVNFFYGFDSSMRNDVIVIYSLTSTRKGMRLRSFPTLHSPLYSDISQLALFSV